MVTDREFRQRGCASVAVSRLLEWFREADALTVSLTASPAAESLYRRLGFSAEGPKAFSIRLEGGSRG
ncbi:GNAT family N-acetyltransferase [Pseudolysinimonas sp.]|uniref:GNAT family N-acetyltransferase n=1 Tax=Pseudolysinimonas sp. TaxID=2680009 RepID=UPI003784F266